METKSCRLTYNVQNSVIIDCMLDMVINTINKDLKAKELLLEIQAALKLYQFIFTEFCASEEDQSTLISCIEIFCGENENYAPQFHNIIQILYKEDVLTDKNIIAWGKKANESIEAYKEKKPVEGSESEEIDSQFDDELDQIGFEQRVKFVQNMQKFLEYLSKEDSSSSSSSEESSSDEDKKSSSGSDSSK